MEVNRKKFNKWINTSLIAGGIAIGSLFTNYLFYNQSKEQDARIQELEMQLGEVKDTNLELKLENENLEFAASTFEDVLTGKDRKYSELEKYTNSVIEYSRDITKQRNAVVIENKNLINRISKSKEESFELYRRLGHVFELTSNYCPEAVEKIRTVDEKNEKITPDMIKHLNETAQEKYFKNQKNSLKNKPYNRQR